MVNKSHIERTESIEKIDWLAVGFESCQLAALRKHKIHDSRISGPSIMRWLCKDDTVTTVRPLLLLFFFLESATYLCCLSVEMTNKLS